MNNTNRVLGSIALIGVVVSVGGALAYAKYTQIQQAMAAPKPPEVPISVTKGEITQISYRQQTTVIGTVISNQSIMLSNEVAGTVRTVGFKSGQFVEKDQVLIQLDTSVEDAELLSAKARVRLSKSTLGRMRRAATSEAVTAAEVEEAEAAFDQANAAVEQLTAIIARKTMSAPFKGRIGLSNTHEGQFLPSGFQIASLQSADDFVYVDFMIPQHAADSVKVTDKVALIDVSGEYLAEVIALDSKADRLSRNLMGRAKLEPIPPQLAPGDSVRVVIEYGPSMQSIGVPPQAIRHAPNETFVFVAEVDNEQVLRAQPRTVVVGKTIGDRVAILAGLKEEDQVVANGAFKVRPNAMVTFEEEAPTETPQP